MSICANTGKIKIAQMSRIVRFCIAGLCFFSVNLTLAQPPGYLGKTTLARVNFDIAPSIAYGFSENLWGPNFRYGLQVERVLTRQFSAGLTAHRLSSRVRYDDVNAVAGEGVGLARVHATAAGGQFRIYQFWRKGNVAPLGPYQQVELMYVRYRVEDLDKRYPPGGLTDLGSYGDLAITVGAGSQRIVADRICIQFGAQVGTLLGVFNTSFRRIAAPQDLGAARLARNYSLTVNVGIGGLFF
jgi:hypothetical protein